MRDRRYGALLAISTLVAVAWLTAFAAAQTNDNRAAEAALQAAINKETVDGELAGAIRLYGAIVDRFSKSDRAAAANALLRMAECYQKLGSGQARSTYERVVREFADQTAAASAARARISAVAARDTRMLRRQVWTGPNVNGAGTVSGDGRFVSFTDADTGDLAIHDLSTGTDARLTDVGQERAWVDFAQDSVISRDGTRVAYSWWINGSKNQLRLLNRIPGTLSSPRILLDNPEISYVAPFDWAPNGEWIAVQVRRVDGTAQIGVVSIADGSLRTLKSVDWRGVTRMSVSPDGAFIAYDLPTGDSTRQRDVFILGRDGSREVSVKTGYAYNTVGGWSPDGKALLYGSERSGSMGLWSVAMAAGSPQGPPQLIDPDLGTFVGSLGITRSGNLVFTKKIRAMNVYVATADFEKGAVVSPPEPITDSYLLNHMGPNWSPDGQFLAYHSGGRAPIAMVIRSLASGHTRDITLRVSNIAFPRWSAADFITFQGADLKGRQGIYRLDVGTGETSQIVGGGEGDGYLSWASATQDGRSVVYTKTRANTFSLIARDLASGQERELAQSVATATTVSPDGRLVAYRTGDKTSSSIMVVPMDGGAPRSILTVTRPAGLAHSVEWLPDGRRLIARRFDNGKTTLLVIRLDGGAPVEFTLPAEVVGSFFRVHPDGRRIAYSAGDQAFEIWTLENFLPGSRPRAEALTQRAHTLDRNSTGQ